MNSLQALNWRYATKVFDPTRKLSQEQLDVLLQAANLTATSVGIQPFRVILVENPTKREELVGAAYGQRQVVDASHLLVLARLTQIDESVVDEYMHRAAQIRGTTVEALAGFKGMVMNVAVHRSADEVAQWASKQAYIALGNLMTVAASLGLDTCPMEGFAPAKVDEILGLESLNLASVLMLPIGYRSEGDKYATTPKVRLDLEQFVTRI